MRDEWANMGRVGVCAMRGAEWGVWHMYGEHGACGIWEKRCETFTLTALRQIARLSVNGGRSCPGMAIRSIISTSGDCRHLSSAPSL